MTNMRQPKTDFGSKTMGASGEKIPGGITASDKSGTRKVMTPYRDSDKQMPKNNRGQTGEREPAGAKSRDESGEKRVAIAGGVGQGQHDSLVGRDSGHIGKHDGRLGEHNDGNVGEGHFYRHTRDYDKSKY